MDMPKGVLLLDIDGTINPFYARMALEQGSESMRGFEEHVGNSTTYGKCSVFLNRGELLENFEALRSKGFELVWASAWNENSNFILELIGAEEDGLWPTVIFPDGISFGMDVLTWKLETVRAWIESRYPPSVPLIWTDDELYEDAERWLASRGSRSLMISPDRNRGLTSTDWQLIQEFADSI